MRCTYAQLKRMINESREMDPNDPSTWPKGWATDVALNVMDDLKNDPSRGLGAHAMFNGSDQLERTLRKMSTMSWGISGLFSMLVTDALFSPENWDKRPTVDPYVVFQHANASVRNPLKLVTQRIHSGRHGAPPKWVTEEFYVMISDVEGHIAHTDDGESVWAFDPETLELLHVPTYEEVQEAMQFLTFNSSPVYARKCDIESGRI